MFRVSAFRSIVWLVAPVSCTRSNPVSLPAMAASLPDAQLAVRLTVSPVPPPPSMVTVGRVALLKMKVSSPPPREMALPIVVAVAVTLSTPEPPV